MCVQANQSRDGSWGAFRFDFRLYLFLTLRITGVPFFGYLP